MTPDPIKTGFRLWSVPLPAEHATNELQLSNNRYFAVNSDPEISISDIDFKRGFSRNSGMSWNAELAYFVTPKSGPMRPMVTLRDANRALLDDLPARCRHQRHWLRVGRLLLAAATKGSRLDLMLATDALLLALDIEGWMTWQPARHQPDLKPATLINLPVHDQSPAPQPLALAA